MISYLARNSLSAVASYLARYFTGEAADRQSGRR
jgi:hypothetical protein